jgi:hypothetical protein
MIVVDNLIASLSRIGGVERILDPGMDLAGEEINPSQHPERERRACTHNRAKLAYSPCGKFGAVVTM